MEVYNQLLNEITNLSVENKKNIELIAQIGVPENKESDLDLLIIMNLYLMKDYKKFSKFIECLRIILKKPLFADLPVFSCYRFRVISEQFNRAGGKNTMPLHIMIYPNLEQFFRLEKSSIIQSFYPKLTPLFGSLDGFKINMKLLSKFDLNARIKEYEMILNEEYTFFKLNHHKVIPNGHFVYMLKYLVKNICGDVLVKKRHDVKNAYSSEYILKNRNELKPCSNSVKPFLELSYLTSYTEKNIDNLFSKAFMMIQGLGEQR